MQIYQGVAAYHLTTLGDAVDAVDRALVEAGMTFTRSPVTVVWPGGRGEGVEFVFVLAPRDQRAGLDLVARLRATGMWLQVRKLDASTPS
ncbi:hypothetical protein Daura_37570 [Dactylosporangium aurantiacum]|uniref:Uncharacterized protein n=1 Tax=Dactylosporangium aurantiacum TaxID=35754 RepID=A0A9Q9MDP5_9ACTN|nr:hypothetical protein [Dactylosporangium aurantiacum]MDG6101872.1 hypothetical protein [Dactylosporangium aurantiacum]UWZ52329.1 hypothetical protein Daura_37570 [Dactylosporangium aurantiacum]